MDLKYEKKDAIEFIKSKKDMDEYIERYIDFLNYAKTEYRAAKFAENMLKENGFVDINSKKKLKTGDKVYFVNNEKSIYAAIIGKDELKDGLNIVGAHIDSPRLDLKPMPLYEKHHAGLLKTQYYGGIKKYQWTTIPLAMYGVIYNEDGKKIEIEVGEGENDPCFTITDLLPHLAREQMKLGANEFIDPEKLVVLVGSLKSDDKETEKVKNSVKRNILKLLNKKYGIKEIDFARSEISLVPAFRARYVGFDYSLVGGYGQDDRSCAYASLEALCKQKGLNQKTAVIMLVDKEEIGSVGNTSMSSNIFDLFITKLIKLKGEEDTSILEVYYNSKMLSADVSTLVDPSYDEVSDIQNGNILGCGIALEKYTGSGGKYSASDANAKYVSEVMQIFEKNNIAFQLGTLGKIEKGGGGTIAYILAEKGVNVIDCGPGVLCMHSPFEITSSSDLYMTTKAYDAFLRA
ncbi:MAG: aminopeptidase [Clostridia bacterium]|nr:aminopeptidase [Clostridia bacterium]